MASQIREAGLGWTGDAAGFGYRRRPRDSQAKLPRQREGAAFKEGPRQSVRKTVAFRTRAQEVRPATEAEKEQLKR